MKRVFLSTFLLLALATTTLAATKEDYQRMDNFASMVRNKLLNYRIEPSWFDGDKFSYCKYLADGRKEFIIVDPATASKAPAFDHQKLAQSLAAALDKNIAADKLPFDSVSFDDNGEIITFIIDKEKWQCNLSDYSCFKPEPAKQPESSSSNIPSGTSPDNKWRITIERNNLYLTDLASSTKTQLTTDGNSNYYWAQPLWSPDSTKLVAFTVIPGDRKNVNIVESSPKDGGRAVLHTFRYDLPGDEFDKRKMYIFDIETQERTEVQAQVYDIVWPNFPGLHWQGSEKFWFARPHRGHQRFEVIEVKAADGSTRNIVDETSETFIRTFNYRNCYFLDQTEELLWLSEKSGYNHIYLVDGETALARAVTSGDWMMRGIDSIDEEKRQIWFRASGVNPQQDPYLIHYYRIDFDGQNMVALTEGDGDHSIRYSPNGKYLIDSYSRIDMPPTHNLRLVEDGSLVMELEKCDMSALLATGWQMPEVFVAKGRDDLTDIWGVFWRPTNFDPAKKYPVIEYIYAGPHGFFVPKRFYSNAVCQSLAELGFIIVQIDGMGTANRSKAFHDVSWQNLQDSGFPDRIKWIKALAEKYDFMDINKVGIYGTSAGGQNSTAAVLHHGDFYKVAVSSCGCHDNRMDKASWNEAWMGYPVGPHYKQQSNITNAHKLKGNLMLVVGELDRNVPPESTLRLADALIKANKEFELVLVPGYGHGDGGKFGRRKRNDFFVKHLLGIDPPDWNK